MLGLVETQVEVFSENLVEAWTVASAEEYAGLAEVQIEEYSALAEAQI